MLYKLLFESALARLSACRAVLRPTRPQICVSEISTSAGQLAADEAASPFPPTAQGQDSVFWGYLSLHCSDLFMLYIETTFSSAVSIYTMIYTMLPVGLSMCCEWLAKP